MTLFYVDNPHCFFDGVAIFSGGAPFSSSIRRFSLINVINHPVLGVALFEETPYVVMMYDDKLLSIRRCTINESYIYIVESSIYLSIHPSIYLTP